MSLTAANAPFPTMILSEDSTPQIEVPTSVTFNLTTPGVTTEAQTITIRNTGSDVLEIATISLRSDHFLLDVPAGLTEIAPGASADLTVTFRPLRAFSVLGSSLRIRSNSGGELGNTFVSLRGNNPLRQVNEDAGDEPEDTTPAPRLLISGSTSFTLDTPGVSTQTVLLTIRNTGDAAFSFGTIQTSTPDFQVAVPAGLTQLAPGASVAIPVTYQPTTPFSFHSSNLTVSSSTSNAAVLSVRLRGNNPLRQVNDGTVVNNDDDNAEDDNDVEDDNDDNNAEDDNDVEGDNDDNNVSPQIDVPASVTFNLTTPGVTTEAQTITIRNTGNGVLEIATISLRSDHFLLDVPTGLTEIAAGASADLTVTFRPLRAFSVLGSSLRIRSNSGGELGNTFVSLRGNNPLRQVNEEAGDEPEDTTPAPRLAISGSTSFSLNTPGVSTQTVLLTIRNTGDAAFSFGTIQTSTPDFQVAVPAGLTQLAPGASVAIPVTYQPTTPFSFHSGNLTVSSSTSNAAVLSVRLRGNNPLRQVNDGTVVNNDDDVEEEEEDNGVPEIEAPETVSFSLNTEGVSTQTQTITISNVGGGVLEFSNIRIFSSNFVLNNAPEALTELAPGASLELSVTYRPRFSSSRHFGNLLISSNAGGSFTSTRVRLRGQNPFRQSNPRKSALSSSFGSITDTAPGVKNGSAATDALSASVFPNPVISVANLRIDAPATVRSVTVEVTNMVGKTVRQLQVNTHGSTTVPVDVADLTAGLYLLRVVDNEGEEAHTIKLLKQ